MPYGQLYKASTKINHKKLPYIWHIIDIFFNEQDKSSSVGSTGAWLE